MSTGRIARDSVASTFGVLLQGGARFAVSVLVGRLAGPSSLAMVNGSLSLAAVASLLWPTSAGQTGSIIIAREEAAGRADLVPAVQRHLVQRTALVVGGILPIVSVTASLVLGTGWANALWVAALTAAFSAYNLARGLQFGRGQVLRAARWEALSAFVTLTLLAGVLVVDLPGLYLLPLTVGYTAYAVGGWPRARGDSSSLPQQLRGELDQYVVWGVVGTVASTGLLHVSMIFAVATESGENAGMYAAAISLATPAALLATAFSMALAPAMARSVGRADPHAIAAQTDSATRALVSAMVLVFGVITILAPSLVLLLFGSAFGDAVGLLRILLVAVLFSTLPVAATNSINTSGSRGVRVSAVMSIASMVAGLAAMGLLAPRLGVAGVASGYLVGTLVKATLPVWYVWRRDRQVWTALMMRVLLGVLAMGAVPLMEPLSPLARFALAILFTFSWTGLSARDLKARSASTRPDAPPPS